MWGNKLNVQANLGSYKFNIWIGALENMKNEEREWVKDIDENSSEVKN